MKTWEMIKELTENPTKEFMNKGDESAYVVVERNMIVWRGKDQSGQMMTVDIDEEWEEVKKPVSFMEAVASGKRIRYPDLFEDEEYLKLDDVLAVLGSNYYPVEVKNIILNGKFYIED